MFNDDVNWRFLFAVKTDGGDSSCDSKSAEEFARRAGHRDSPPCHICNFMSLEGEAQRGQCVVRVVSAPFPVLLVKLFSRLNNHDHHNHDRRHSTTVSYG